MFGSTLKSDSCSFVGGNESIYSIDRRGGGGMGWQSYICAMIDSNALFGKIVAAQFNVQLLTITFMSTCISKCFFFKAAPIHHTVARWIHSSMAIPVFVSKFDKI